MAVARAEIEPIIRGQDGAAVADLLGPHTIASGGLRILAFVPGADQVFVQPDDSSISRRPMEVAHQSGVFLAEFDSAREPFRYRLIVESKGTSRAQHDPYSFPPLISDLDLFTIGEGTNVQAYDVLGAHPRIVDGVAGVQFAVWAPHARWLSVIGDFNDWNVRRHPCRRRGAGGIWELFIPEVTAGALYKFHIESRLKNYMVDKTDPFAFHTQLRPDTASIVTDLHGFPWNDHDWIAQRAQSLGLEKPLAIYEVHAGSWKRTSEGAYLGYRELAHELVAYVKSMGFTSIELMPITEHPFDVSWGYQTTGYYAPTSRYGAPKDFMYFVDYCHQHGIGVFVDWVPSHFAKEGHGLGFFDGAHLYEHADPRQGEHLDWGTFVFNYGRGEVLTFLLSNAMYWLDQYHIDGFRVDAVASMLYLDHQRPAGAWVANKYGGRENLEAVEFLRRLNVLVHDRYPGVLTMAEESTSWPMVSRPVYLGGLGFTLKWDMGWMHDTLEYIKADPVYRRFLHNTITFSLVYHYSENFLLPLSHDEVVHAKSPLVYKAPGDEWQKFATLRLLFGYMWAHPGKKLLFMGGEFGQTSEWNYAAELPWNLLQYPRHQGVQQWVKDLNTVYTSRPELSVLDYDPAGFEWIDCKDVDNSILIMMRKGKPESIIVADNGGSLASAGAGTQGPALIEELSQEELDQQQQAAARAEASRPFCIIACNFTPIVRHGYAVGVPRLGRYREILNSDHRQYGGSGVINEGMFEAWQARIHARDQAIRITLPPLGVSMLELVKE